MQLKMPSRFRPRFETPRATTPRGHRWLGVLAAFAFAALSSAADVEFRLPPREAWVGLPVLLEVSVKYTRTIELPPKAPEIEGMTVRELPAEASFAAASDSQGRYVATRAQVFRFSLRPEREGEFEIPPIEVRADGKTFSSQPSTIVAKKSVTGDLLQVKVLADPPRAYVGQSIQFVLQIVVRAYENEEFGVNLSEREMWSFFDLKESSWGIFRDALDEMGRRGRRPLGREIEVNDHRFYVYSIDLASRQALRPGTPDLGDVSVLMVYPTSLRWRRDFFGDPEPALADVRPLVATPEVEGIEVLPLPEEGRPAWFSGAVGDFSIRTRATPLEVSVGDPITLSIEIVDRTGDSVGLALLQPPKLEAVEALMADFRIPAGSLAGEVDGRTKTFNQTIRPISADITEVPAIPFSWFDPESREYRTAWSEPIAIVVKPTETMSLSQIVQSGGSPPRPGPAGAANGASSEGLLANLPGTSDLLRDEAIDLDWRVVAVVAAPPVLAIGAIVFLRHRRRLLEDEGLARASRARRTALKRLRTGDADAIAAAISGYVADRGRMPSPTITRQEVREALESLDAEDALVDEIDRILRSCERSRFAGDRFDGRGLIEQSTACLAKLDRLRWSRPAALGAAS
jgi:hypothetical protein